jgi:hypothetical protein
VKSRRNRSSRSSSGRSAGASENRNASPSRVNRCSENTSSTVVSGFSPMNTLYPNSISPLAPLPSSSGTDTMSRGTQLFSVRIRSAPMSRSSVPPNTSRRRALRASARRASSPACSASRCRSTS